MSEKKSKTKSSMTNNQRITWQSGNNPTVTTRSKNQSVVTNIQQQNKAIKDADWFVFVSSYLKCCRILIVWLRDGEFDDEHKKVVLALAYSAKHAIEIIIKAYTRLVKSKADNSSYSHDINTLFSGFKDLYKDKSIVDETVKFEKLVHKYSTLEVFRKKLDGCVSFVDKDNSFFRYPDPTLQVDVNYQELISRLTIDDVLNIEIDLNELDSIIKQLSKTLSS